MKTDQLMVVKFRKGDLQIYHKSGMGLLNRIFETGNLYRAEEGKSPLFMAPWLAMSSTKEYIALVSDKIGAPAINAKRGKGGHTYAHLHVLLDAATYLSAEFKYEVFETFIENRLLGLRDSSGDEFVGLNAALVDAGESVLGKPAHSGHFINLAKIMRKRILPEDHPGWNFADVNALTERVRVERQLVTLLKLGLVRDWEHLKELAEKV